MRTVTVFDFHRTFNEMLKLPNGLRDIEHQLHRNQIPQTPSRGMSVFRPIDVDRSCYSHGIMIQFCSCLPQLNKNQVPTDITESLTNITQVMDLLNCTDDDLINESTVITKWSMHGQSDVARSSIRNFNG